MTESRAAIAYQHPPRGRARATASGVCLGMVVWLSADAAPCLPAADEQAPAPSHAQRLRWAPYPRVRPFEYALTFSAPVLLGLIEHNTRESDFPRWNRPILFDTHARDVLVARSPRAITVADEVSDVTWYATSLWPLFDAAFVAWAADDNPDVAWQLAAIGLQANALTGLVTLTAIRGSARRRPRTAACLTSGVDEEECAIPPRGFPSGHTSGSFTGAGLVCSSHLALALYGSKVADGAACGGALALATTTLLLRVRADAHYASDSLVGAGIGLASGWLMPRLLHYPALAGTGQAELVVVPALDQGSLTLSATGRF